VINKGKNPRTNIGILCYLTTFPSRLFPPKLEHGQFQALDWNLNSFAIRHFIFFLEDMSKHVDYVEKGT
jgi:hypothetical protein